MTFPHIYASFFPSFIIFFFLGLKVYASYSVQIYCGLALITDRIFSKVCHHHPFLCNPLFWYRCGNVWKWMKIFFGSANLTFFSSSSFLCYIILNVVKQQSQRDNKDVLRTKCDVLDDGYIMALLSCYNRKTLTWDEEQ